MSLIYYRTAFQRSDRASLSAVTWFDYWCNSWGDLSKTIYVAGWNHFGLISITMKIPIKPIDREGSFTRHSRAASLEYRMMKSFLLIFAVLLTTVSCTKRTAITYVVSIMPDRVIWNGKAMTQADIEKDVWKDYRKYGLMAFMEGRVSIHIEPEVRYGRVMSYMNVQCLSAISECSLAVGREKPVPVFIRNGDYTGVLEELITIDEGNIRTKDGVMPFKELDQYLAVSKAIDKNFRVILNATTNAFVKDFYGALVVSKRHTDDVLWMFGDGAIVSRGGDWERWRPHGNILTECKRNP